MTLHSDYRLLTSVILPYRGRQKYMHGFDITNPVMAEGYEDYLDPVLLLLHAAGATHGQAWMTVDEKIVKAGMSQRRPGPHVDGCFQPAMNWWGQQEERWNHTCNNIERAEPFKRMPIIVAASVPGCRAWRGVFDGAPDAGGDLSHIQDQLQDGVVIPAGMGALLSPDCVHESMIFTQDTQRTFLRIALPTSFEFKG